MRHYDRHCSPHTWWASGVGYGGVKHASFPSQRIKNAATSTGHGAAYASQSIHGVDR